MNEAHWCNIACFVRAKQTLDRIVMWLSPFLLGDKFPLHHLPIYQSVLWGWGSDADRISTSYLQHNSTSSQWYEHPWSSGTPTHDSMPVSTWNYVDHIISNFQSIRTPEGRDIFKLHFVLQKRSWPGIMIVGYGKSRTTPKIIKKRYQYKKYDFEWLGI